MTPDNPGVNMSDPDAGSPDSGAPDIGAPDVGSPDAGRDAEDPDRGAPDGGQRTACDGVDCSPFPCENGLCVDANGDGDPECVCDDGWSGRNCSTCADGFAYDDTAADCVPDVCFNVACGHGTCGASPLDGNAACFCDDGYAGDACDECARGYTWISVGGQLRCLNELPVRDSRVVGWFDAAAAGTLSLDGDRVTAWNNRVFPDAMNERGTMGTRPRYLLLPEPAVEFDGNDGLTTTDPLVKNTEAYTIFTVVDWDPDSERGVVVHGGSFDVGFLGYEVFVDDDTVTFLHHDNQNNLDTLELPGYDPAGPRLLVASWQPFLNGRAMSFTDGLEERTAMATSEDLFSANAWTTTLGMSPAGSFAFEGRIHEVIFVNGTLTQDEREAIAAYLDVKWGL